MLAKLLAAGVRPRMVAMLVLSQVPPPFAFAPLALDTEHHPPALYSCSVAAAAAVLRPSPCGQRSSRDVRKVRLREVGKAILKV